MKKDKKASEDDLGIIRVQIEKGRKLTISLPERLRITRIEVTQGGKIIHSLGNDNVMYCDSSWDCYSDYRVAKDKKRKV